MRLVDSPGFQSSDAKHTEQAMESFPEASAIIYLFQPNLMLGDDSQLIKVLRGDSDLGIAPKKGRTFFVVNRSDELGVDPETDPVAFKELVARKKNELSLALAARNISVQPRMVFCMASDPFGLVGDRSDVDATAFDPFRAWDGFAPFMAAFRRARPGLLRAGVDRSILEGGLARLARLASAVQVAVEALTARDIALARLQTQIDEAVAEGARLGGKHRVLLTRLVSDQADAFKEDVVAEQDPQRLKVKADRFKEWWNDEALQEEIRKWAARTSEELSAWRDRSEEAIRRRLESAEFRAAFSAHQEDAPDADGTGGAAGWYKDAFSRLGSALKMATHKRVYDIGKALGFKFKPWGAVNLAKNLGKAGAVLAVVGVGWDIADLFLSERQLARREEARKKLAAFLRESVPRIVETVADGSEEEPGLLRTLISVTKALEDARAQESEMRASLASELAMARTRLATYAAVREDACNLLGNPWRET